LIPFILVFNLFNTFKKSVAIRKSASVTDVAKLYTFISEAIRKSASVTDMAKLYTFHFFFQSTFFKVHLFRIGII
jgi:hypothetical protein